MNFLYNRTGESIQEIILEEYKVQFERNNIIFSHPTKA